MNKITTLTIIAAAALLFGMMTPDFLVADATGKNSTSEPNQNNNKNINHNDNHDDENDDNHDNHDDENDDDHDDENDDDHTHSGNHTTGGGSVVIDPPTIKVYKVVINNAGNPIPTVASFGVKLNNTQITTNGTVITVAQNKPVVLTESGLTGYQFVEIRGDGHCPENLGGTITLDNAQHIECYIVNQPTSASGSPIQPGVIFRYNTLDFNRVDPSVGDSCSAPGKTDPCVELANVGRNRSFLVVDDALKTDTTIVLFSVLENGKVTQNPPQFATSPLCTLSGIGPHTTSYAQDPEFSPVTNPTGKMGFEFQCSLLDAESLRVSYALIETQR